MVTVIATILIFLLMISLHEFGHFISGKLLGFNVLEYAIGFGPAIFKKQGKKTLYSLRLIPFGGYCKFAGEDGENEQGEGDFSKQPALKRIIVLASGAIFNVLLGFVLFVIFTANSGRIIPNEVNVIPGSYIEQAGIVSGDEIVEINGKNVDFWYDITLATDDLNKDSVVDITIKRNGEKISVKAPLSEEIIKTTYFADFAVEEISLNGNAVMQEEIPYSDDFKKDENKIGTSEIITQYILGISAKPENVSISNVLPNSYYMTKFVVKLVYNTVFDLVTGDTNVDQLSGPVGVVSVVNDAVEDEYTMLNLLNLTALLTINLGIFNLLPLPALDGGRILFVLIEMIRRKPISPEKEGLVHSIGFLLLILLMIFVSYQDIMKLF